MRFSNIHTLEPELEREAYEKFHRYLKHMTPAALDARYLAIRRHSRLAEIAATAHPELRNLTLGDYRNPMFWVRKELLTTEEFRLRGDVLPADSIPPIGVRSIPRPISLDGKKPGGADFLVKYGECRHLLPMLEHGAIRLNAASFYKKAENNEARLDDELSKHDFMPGECVKVSDKSGNPIRVLGDLRYTKSIADYYLLCASNEFDPALFDAFKSEITSLVGCVIIHDPKQFALRLAQAVRVLLPNWQFSHSNVEYYDPYELEPGQRPHPVMSKSISFVYQKEHRFFWVSDYGDCPAPFFDVQIGSLKDIAELVGCPNDLTFT
jgi:hypothetical protein